MKFTKRITSLVLAFVLVSASLFTYVQAASFSDVPETNPYYNAINELVASGVINGYEDGTFKPDNTITRAEYSKILAVASAPMGYSFTANTTTFSDIPNMDVDHGWAVPYIQYAVSTKAVNGYEDGTFRPGNPVTYGEAVKMIVCTLGYGPVVDTTLTPWYQGYINIAQQIGLTIGAISAGDAPASRGIVAQLTANMFDCKPLVQTGVDQNGNPVYSTGGEDSNFGDEKDNATSEEGVLLGVYDYSLDGATVGKNKIRVATGTGAVTYSLTTGLSTDSLKAYVGYRVSYAYTGTSSNREIIRVSPVTDYNSEVTVDRDMIASLNGSLIEYYADEAAERKDEKTRVSYTAPYVVYNGVPVNPASFSSFASQYLTLSNFDTGSIKLLSNDASESNAEVLFIENYVTYYVNSPSNSNGDITIYDKNKAITNLADLTIDEDDATDVTKVTSKGGKPSSSQISAITNKSVVSIAVPYGAASNQTAEGTKVIISTATVTGDINGISDAGTIKIASTEYEFSPYYEKVVAPNAVTANLKVGDNAKFYLDYLGRIVAMEKNETSDPYGLIIAYDGGSGINSTTIVKMLTVNNTKTDYALKSTISVNGTSGSAADAVSALDTANTINDNSNPNIVAVPVIYKVSGSVQVGEKTYQTISAIQTLDDSASNHISKGQFTYSSSGRTFKDGSTEKFSMLTSGTDAATVFVIPNNVSSFDDYSKKSASYFTDNVGYTVAAYEMNGTANAKIVLCYLSSGQTTTTEIVPSTNVYIVENITDIGEGAKKFSGKNIMTGDEFSVDTNIEASVLDVAANVQIGDLIRYVIEDEKICDLRRVYTKGQLFDYAGDAPSNPVYYVENGNGSDTNYYQAHYGTVDQYNVEGNQLVVIPQIYTSSALTEGKKSLTTTSDTKYYRSYTVNGNTKIEQSSMGALNAYNESKNTAPQNASKVVVIVMRDYVQAVYIEQR